MKNKFDSDYDAAVFLGTELENVLWGVKAFKDLLPKENQERFESFFQDGMEALDYWILYCRERDKLNEANSSGNWWKRFFRFIAGR